ncbi:DsbA family protein [Streptomyces sp. NPDC101132]|uniref:DsbA family protein n=1 Tax=Streptomyces sp. NPDC101132 TaxID=3366110 RepID=UPI00380F7502
MVVMGKGVRRAGRLPRLARGVAAAAAVAVLAGTAVACSSGGGPGSGALAADRPDGEVRTSPIADRLAELPAKAEGTTIVVGDPAAPRTARVMVDPHCGYCRVFEGAGGEELLKAAADGKVKVEYLLASFLDQGGSGSLKAVNALRASVDRGRFAEYHAAVFASQPRGAFTDARLLEIASEVPGLRGAEFDRAVRDMTYRDWAVRSEAAFEATGAQGTPLVLVDGEPVGVQDRSMFDAEAFAETLKGVGIA